MTEGRGDDRAMTHADELRADDDLLRLVTEMSSVAVWEYDVARDEMRRSANHDALYGLDWQNPWRIGTFLESTHPDDTESSGAIIAEAMAAGGPDEYAYDFRVIWPDGSVRWLWVRGRVTSRDESGRGTIVRGVLIDVTDRKAIEERLRRSMLLYETLSECNQAIVFSSDETELFARVCAAAVTIGSAAMAWVGMVGSSGVVEAVAQIGEGAEEFLAARADLLAKGAAIDLATAAIVADAPVIRQVGTDDGPIAAAMVERGWLSATAMPIRRGGVAVGAFTLYSDTLGFFDDAMDDLLAEMAGDLGFALDHFEQAATVAKHIAAVEASLSATVEVATSLSEMRDPYTAGHQRRVGEIAAAIGEELGLSPDRLEGLRVAGRLHDIGKIAIPAEILTRPGRLSDEERALIQLHPQAGYDVLADVPFPWPVALVALQHHERLDGSGYPSGLTGESIILEARIVAVADVLEAMSSHRPYRESLGVESALAEIEAGAGTRYDAAVVAACVTQVRGRDFLWG